MTATLRRAVPADAVACATMHAACWREAYGPYVDVALLEERLAETAKWTAAWTRHLVDGPPRVLAEVDGEPVGFSVVGPTRDEHAATPYELYAIYTRAAYWGSGLGQELELCRSESAQWARETGNAVEVVPMPADATQRRAWARIFSTPPTGSDPPRPRQAAPPGPRR